MIMVMFMTMIITMINLVMTTFSFLVFLGRDGIMRIMIMTHEYNNDEEHDKRNGLYDDNDAFMMKPSLQWSTVLMDQWTNRPMDYWTNGPMDQWTSGPMI